MIVTLKTVQPNMKQVLVDNKPFAVAIKDDGAVILDHVGSEDETIFTLTTAEGNTVKHWTQVAEWVRDYFND